MKTATAPLPPLRSVKVLDQLRERIRYLHYSLRTEQAYVNWVRAFIRFHGVRHPATLGSSEVEAFLSWLANERKVSVSTHRQALAALLFFYGKVLCTDLPWLQEIGRPRPSRRLPVVLTPDEVVRILGFLEGEHRLFAQDSSYSSSGWLPWIRNSSSSLIALPYMVTKTESARDWWKNKLEPILCKL